MDSAKVKVRKAVQDYRKHFPDEYQQFLKGVQEKQAMKKDEWATTGGSNVIDRHMFDLPEILFYSLKRNLTETEWNWLFGHEEFLKDYRGMKWFMKEFKQFTVTKEF